MVQDKEIAAAEDAIVEEFALLDDWQDKYAHLIDIGRALPKLDSQWKTDDRKVKGCQSQVWLVARKQDGRMFFEAESDALIVQGLIALLLRVYSGRTPEAIAASTPDFLRRIGLDRHLSQNRTNGLFSMIREIHRHAGESLA